MSECRPRVETPAGNSHPRPMRGLKTPEVEWYNFFVTSERPVIFEAIPQRETDFGRDGARTQHSQEVRLKQARDKVAEYTMKNAKQPEAFV